MRFNYVWNDSTENLARQSMSANGIVNHTIETDVSPSDIDLFTDVKEQNPAFYDALIYACAVLPQRSKKYSGSDDPYTNFILVGEMLKSANPTIDMSDTFLFYVAIKFARLMVSGKADYDDDSVNDTLRDLANYALLALGWRLRESRK